MRMNDHGSVREAHQAKRGQINRANRRKMLKPSPKLLGKRTSSKGKCIVNVETQVRIKFTGLPEVPSKSPGRIVAFVVKSVA